MMNRQDHSPGDDPRHSALAGRERDSSDRGQHHGTQMPHARRSFQNSPPPDIITQLPADARAASCNAFQLPNFTPYVVRPGDTLPMLLASSTALTVAPAAALNCLDNPYALPVGAVIFLPARQEEREAVVGHGGDAAAIVAFARRSETVRNTEGAAFSWSGTGDAAYFFPCPVDEHAGCSRPSTAKPLPGRRRRHGGSCSYAGEYRYALEIIGTGEPVMETITLSVRCALVGLGGHGARPLCPEEPPRAVFAAWQSFEHGIMLWFSDTARSRALGRDGTFRIYGDTYVEGMPESPLSPPEGLNSPGARIPEGVGGAGRRRGIRLGDGGGAGFRQRAPPAGRLGSAPPMCWRRTRPSTPSRN